MADVMLTRNTQTVEEGLWSRLSRMWLAARQGLEMATELSDNRNQTGLSQSSGLRRSIYRGDSTQSNGPIAAQAECGQVL